MSAKIITLQLSPEMQAFVDHQVKDGEFSDAEDYLSHLLRAEQKRKAKQEFERTLPKRFALPLLTRLLPFPETIETWP